MSTKELILVDEQNNPVGTCDKILAHREGLLHRAISIMLFDDQGKILLQRRNDKKYHSGGLWANACCSHPFPNEAAKSAAIRRVKEELGIQCKLDYEFERTYLARVSQEMVENEYVVFFSGVYSGKVDFNTSEVSQITWESPSSIDNLMKKKREIFAAWFQIYWRDHRDVWENISVRSLG